MNIHQQKKLVTLTRILNQKMSQKEGAAKLLSDLDHHIELIKAKIEKVGDVE